MTTVATEPDSLSAYGEARSTIEGSPLTADELRRMDAYWRASLYLCLGMIYLKDNPLLREPITLDHLKTRLLGHWGSDPGQSFVYIHLNRLIKKDDLDVIFLSGPGHGAPALLSNAYLEGTYSEVYPDKSEDLDGLRKFFKAVLLPRRHRQPLHPRDPGLDPRGGRARLLRLARLRSGLRRPRPGRRGHGRRRRGGDRPAGDRLALQQVPQPHPRRRRAAGPPPERLQDQQPVDPRPDQPPGAGGVVRGVRLHAVLRRGLRAREHAPGDGRDARALRRGDPGDPGGRPADGRRPAAALADGRPPQPEGLDRPRARWTATTSRASGGRTRCRSGTSARTPRT